MMPSFLKTIRNGRSAARDRYLVNFLRDRDAYHVPAAMSATNKLECLITDIYYDRAPYFLKKTLLRGIEDHRSDRLSSVEVRNCYTSAAIQIFDKLITKGKFDLSYHADRALGRATKRYFDISPTSMFLYSGYALESFRAARGTDVRKLLFLFHPHHKLISDILKADMDAYPQFRSSFEADLEVSGSWRHHRADEELALADGVVAASGFSLKSAAYFGSTAPKYAVPYFTEVAPNPEPYSLRSDGQARFLFVGQGIQRKGLHHLFMAWERAGLTDATLTCVCSRMHKTIAEATPAGVQVKTNLSKEELQLEFDRAHVFVMPSLVEGFGLVYLEAQRRGAYVIGTTNTGLPDITQDEELAVSLPAGQIEPLTQMLVIQYNRIMKGMIDHKAIVEFSEKYRFDQYALAMSEAISKIESNKM
ncbi:glycosyltransferase [Caulobacter sp. SSI4214]|uniref:glycosyltransferase n=1 Tax=Caulobacter sp. SSI4214 TaxID=2575739 RepID=UPI00143A9D29|nr:glycosyltransferase [Caulobacter sp. SSI4214]